MAFDRRIASEGVEVQAVTVADVIRMSGFDRVDLMKIDVEGAEAEILAGDLSWLDRVDAVMIELHGTPREDEFKALMEERGFRYSNTRGTPTAVRQKAR